MRPLNKGSIALGAALAAFALALLGPGADPASANYSFCPPGTGAGQCANPEGVATDFETGRAYVADTGNRRVDVFEVKDEGAEWEFLFAFGWGVDSGAGEFEQCTTASGCQAGIAGAGAGQFSTPRWIAVDNVEGSPTRHHVYVTDRDNNRVDHFDAEGDFEGAFGWGVDTGAAELELCTTASTCQAGIGPTGSDLAGECQLGGNRQPVSVGPGGNVFVAVTTGAEPKFTTKIEKFSPEGACLGETTLWEEANRRVTSIAVDAAEDAYVSVEGAGGEIRKYALGVPPSEPPLCEPDPGVGTVSLGLDEAGHLFAFQQETGLEGSHRVIAEYDDACNPLRRFAYDTFSKFSGGVAPFHSAGGDVLASEPDVGVHYLGSGVGPVVAAKSLQVGALGATKARIEAEVNTEDVETTVRIQYVDEESYQEDGFEGPNTREGPPETIPASGFRVVAVSALAGCADPEEGGCLQPRTTYRYRVLTSHPGEVAGSESSAEGEPFVPAEHLKGLWAQDVGTDTATLAISADPYGVPTTAHLEYVDEQSFQESGFDEAIRVPAAGELDFGSGEGVERRSATLYPLPSGASYRYRAVIGDPVATLTTEPKAFTVFRKAAYPPCANDALRYGAAALLPDCRAYELVSPLDKANGDIVVLPQILTSLPAVLSKSSASGERLTYGSYRALGDAESAPYTSQYLASRGPEGWRSEGISPPRDASLTENVGAEFDFEYRAFSDDLCEGWLSPLAEPPLAEGAGEGHRNLYRRELCGAEGYRTLVDAEPENLDKFFIVEPQGISADGEVVAFAANDRLEGSGAPAQPVGCTAATPSPCKIQLYVKGEVGPPRFACVRPDKTPSPGHCSAGTEASASFGKARSANLPGALSEDGTRLYWTDSGDEGPLYLREDPLGEGAECSGPGAPCTYPVSEAAELETGASASHFWAAAADGSRAIFSTAKNSRLYEYDASTREVEPIAAGLRGFLGASEDARRVYFASGEAIAGSGENSEGAEAQEGAPNLYLYEAGEGGGSYRFIATLAEADVSFSPPLEHSSATAREPAFHNGRVDASGLRAAFMSRASLTGYDNADAESGAADQEVFLYDASGAGGAGEILCASCNPSGARPAGANLGGPANPFWVAARLPVLQTALYPSRLISADGQRLIFEAQDSLVARDSNGRLDVYQWERAGKGACSASAPTYSPEASGCIDLISSGQSRSDSELLDASASGDDVFFTTLSGLYPADYGLVDVYDARAGGGYPAPPADASECEGESCQSPPPAPEAPSPASSTYQGPGDLAAPAPRCTRPARKARRLSARAKRLRTAARRSRRPALKAKRLRAARRSASSARRQARNAKRCRARARKARSKR